MLGLRKFTLKVNFFYIHLIPVFCHSFLHHFVLFMSKYCDPDDGRPYDEAKNEFSVRMVACTMAIVILLTTNLSQMTRQFLSLASARAKNEFSI